MKSVFKMKKVGLKKFQASKWTECLQEKAFRARVLEIMDEEIIIKFKNRDGDAKIFYEEEEEEGSE